MDTRFREKLKAGKIQIIATGFVLLAARETALTSDISGMSLLRFSAALYQHRSL